MSWLHQADGFSRDVGVIGGAGHVGLPLALLFCKHGLQVEVVDVDTRRLALLERGELPFVEEGGLPLLLQALASGRIGFGHSPAKLATCRVLVVVVGTPVDEHLNPKLSAIQEVLAAYRPVLRDGQTVILRSTLFPGTTEYVGRRLQDDGLRVGVAYCPERVAQGHSLRECQELPQIVSALDDESRDVAIRMFGLFAPRCIVLTPMEAELCKLMTNSWRYIQFATVNQFFTIATQHGLDFDRILEGCRADYPRTAGMPGPGFAAGPCLMKDTLQLAAFSQHHFMLGHSAMLANESLPEHMVALAQRQRPLRELCVGVLGMAFKANSDDSRDSLSYKLRKLLSLAARQVLCTDPFVVDPSLVPLQEVLERAQVLFVGAPHDAYRGLAVPASTLVVDVWSSGFFPEHTVSGGRHCA